MASFQINNLFKSLNEVLETQNQNRAAQVQEQKVVSLQELMDDKRAEQAAITRQNELADFDYKEGVKATNAQKSRDDAHEKDLELLDKRNEAKEEAANKKPVKLTPQQVKYNRNKASAKSRMFKIMDSIDRLEGKIYSLVGADAAKKRDAATMLKKKKSIAKIIGQYKELIDFVPESYLEGVETETKAPIKIKKKSSTFGSN